MYTSNVVGAVALLFILAMAILRIRMQYARGAHRRLRLTGVGAAYFAVLVVLLGSGWFLAPRLGDGTAFQVTLARVAAFPSLRSPSTGTAACARSRARAARASQGRAVESRKASRSRFIFAIEGGCTYIMWPAS